MAIVDIVYPNTSAYYSSTGSGTTIADITFRDTACSAKSIGTIGGYLKGLSYDGNNLAVWTGSGVTISYPILGGHHIIKTV